MTVISKDVHKTLCPRKNPKWKQKQYLSKDDKWEDIRCYLISRKFIDKSLSSMSLYLTSPLVGLHKHNRVKSTNHINTHMIRYRSLIGWGKPVWLPACQGYQPQYCLIRVGGLPSYCSHEGLCLLWRILWTNDWFHLASHLHDIHPCVRLLGYFFMNFGTVMGGFSSQTNVCNLHKLSVFWANYCKNYPIWVRLGVFLYKIGPHTRQPRDQIDVVTTNLRNYRV